jgi:hypothetical protein
MASVTLPVAGTLTNYNPLLAEGYAGKTGSDSAAGGCLAFFTHVTVGGQGLTAVGVVLGQRQGNDTRALLAAAGRAAQQLVGSVAPTRVRTIAARAAGGGGGDAGGPGRLPARTDVNAITTAGEALSRERRAGAGLLAVMARSR